MSAASQSAALPIVVELVGVPFESAFRQLGSGADGHDLTVSILRATSGDARVAVRVPHARTVQEARRLVAKLLGCPTEDAVDWARTDLVDSPAPSAAMAEVSPVPWRRRHGAQKRARELTARL